MDSLSNIVSVIAVVINVVVVVYSMTRNKTKDTEAMTATMNAKYAEFDRQLGIIEKDRLKELRDIDLKFSDLTHGVELIVKLQSTLENVNNTMNLLSSKMMANEIEMDHVKKDVVIIFNKLEKGQL